VPPPLLGSPGLPGLAQVEFVPLDWKGPPILGLSAWNMLLALCHNFPPVRSHPPDCSNECEASPSPHNMPCTPGQKKERKLFLSLRSRKLFLSLRSFFCLHVPPKKSDKTETILLGRKKAWSFFALFGHISGCVRRQEQKFSPC
jgi:hypothetical protein